MKSVFIWLVAIASFVLIIGAYFVVRSGYEKSRQDKEIQQEIDDLIQEAESLESKNVALSEKIAYFKTPDFKEKLAKEKLNYKKEGEEMVIIKPSTHNNVVQEEVSHEDVAGDVESIEIPNHMKWWNYFFGNK